MKIIKITNVHWLPRLGTRIAELANRLDTKTIQPESLYVHFANMVQFGGENSEFWAVMENNEPIAFASWFVMGHPHVGAINMDYIYNWSRKKDAVRLLVDEWIEYGKRKRAKYYYGTAINSQTLEIFKKYAGEINLNLDPVDITNFICWR